MFSPAVFPFYLTARCLAQNLPANPAILQLHLCWTPLFSISLFILSSFLPNLPITTISPSPAQKSLSIPISLFSISLVVKPPPLQPNITPSFSYPTPPAPTFPQATTVVAPSLLCIGISGNSLSLPCPICVVGWWVLGFVRRLGWLAFP